MAEINDLSTTDANNNGAAANAGFPEGMPPSDVNDAARALEGMLARWHKDTNGSLVATGSSNAYAVAANRTISAYYDGLHIVFEANHQNSGAATLNVDGVGAKTIKKNHDQDLASGDIESGQKVGVLFDSDADVWEMYTHVANAALSAGDIGTTVQGYDADTLFADTSDNLTVGFTTDEEAIGNSGTGTVTPSLATEALKTLTINGSHTLAPPSSGNGVCQILATNDGSGGYTVTTSGFTYVDGTYNAAAGALNLFRITKFASTSFLEIIDLTGL